MIGLALELLRYAAAAENNARHLSPGPIGEAIAARAAVMRKAAEALVPGIARTLPPAGPATKRGRPPAPEADAAAPDDLAGEDLAASRAMIPR